MRVCVVLGGYDFPFRVFIYVFSLKQKVSYKEEEEEDDDVKEPSWEKQEAMVRRLQKKFPDQDKEVRHTNAECVTHQDTLSLSFSDLDDATLLAGAANGSAGT